MGVVYKARDTKLERLVAIKVLPSDKLVDEERRRRFIQEAKAASALNHPNIVTIHEISTVDGIDFMVMEFVPGKTLAELIRPGGMRFIDALKYASQIAAGLARAHSAGIVHRDLKPSNIIVSNQGLAKILDFGLAKLGADRTASQEGTTFTMEIQSEEDIIVGTAPYMSPEQAQGLAVDHRSDIFSFGAILYEMVTGAPAFEGPTKVATLSSVISDEPRPIAEIRDSVPGELEKLISRCLRKDPERRIYSMVDVRLALDEIREEFESGIVAPALTAKRTLRPWLYASVALGLVAAGIYYYFVAGAKQSLLPFQTAVLTSYPGVERDPALSPDGRQVAFSWNGEKEDNSDIYVKLVDAGSPVRITTNDGYDARPRWSPDGRFLAFLRRLPKGLIEYYTIPSLGGQERLVIKLMHEGQPLFVSPNLDWTPDGKGILISDTTQASAPLVVVSIDTGEKQKITSPPPKSWGISHPDFRQMGANSPSYASCGLACPKF